MSGGSRDRLPLLRTKLAAAPHDERSRLELAQALSTAGEADAAKATAAPLLDSYDDEVWEKSMSLLGHLHERAGEHNEALKLWERLLAVDVDHPAARAHLQRLNRALVPATPLPRMPLRPEATLLSPEGVIAARYEILAELGRGTTSTVFLARDAHLDLQVALKVLHPFLAASSRSELRQRFFREARLAAGLRHPGVVAIYDLDEETRSLAMEYLPMGTLRHRLNDLGQDGQAMPLEEVRATTKALLATLAAVHDAGLLHGDLKPRNILLRGIGGPVLGDFGVARLLSANPQASGVGPAGTPLYFAPEQLLGADSTVRTDLFAMGAIVWEMAAGRPMRTRADLTSGRFEAPPFPSELTPTWRITAPDLLDLVAALTAAEPAARPLNAQAALAILG